MRDQPNSRVSGSTKIDKVATAGALARKAGAAQAGQHDPAIKYRQPLTEQPRQGGRLDPFGPTKARAVSRCLAAGAVSTDARGATALEAQHPPGQLGTRPPSTL